MDVAQITALLGGHPNTARAHLEGLVDQRLATRTPVVTGRRGRPRIAYEPTLQGRLALGPSGIEELVEAVARYLAAGDGASAGAVAVGRIWGALLADGSGAGRDNAQDMLTLLDHAGFSPRRDPAAADLDIALQTCPFLDTARAHPHVVCELHRGMVVGALTAYGRPADQVQLRPFAEPGACRLRIQPGAPG